MGPAEFCRTPCRQATYHRPRSTPRLSGRRPAIQLPRPCGSQAHGRGWFPRGNCASLSRPSVYVARGCLATLERLTAAAGFRAETAPRAVVEVGVCGTPLPGEPEAAHSHGRFPRGNCVSRCRGRRGVCSTRLSGEPEAAHGRGWFPRGNHASRAGRGRRCNVARSWLVTLGRPRGRGRFPRGNLVAGNAQLADRDLAEVLGELADFVRRHGRH